MNRQCPKFLVYWVGSLGFHLGAFFLFQLGSDTAFEHRQPPIVWIEPSESVLRKSIRSQELLLKKQLGLAELGLKWQGKGGARIPDELLNEMGESGDPDRDPILNRTATAGIYRMSRVVLNDRVTERIDQSLGYPDEFYEGGIEGVIEARLIFDESGRFREERSSFRGASRYLKVYVAQVMRRCFNEPLSTTFLRGKSMLELRCLFAFSLSGKGFAGIGVTPMREAKDASETGVLTFFRAAKPFGTWHLGPVAGYGVAPALGVDVEWVADKLKEAVSGAKAKMDPLEKYRRDPAW